MAIYSFPTIPGTSVPSLTASQMRAVDQIAIEHYGLSLLQMMEDAGGRLAELTIRRFTPGRVAVLAGKGGNGGGGLSAARHLVNRGVAVKVTLSHRATDVGAAASHQLRILERMEVPILEEPEPADVIIDALVRYSLKGKWA